MADKENKSPGNVPGKYYVDTNCTLCGICADEAPENFELGDDYAFVKKQPENDEEEAKASEAMEGCPEEAIGNDG